MRARSVGAISCGGAAAVAAVSAVSYVGYAYGPGIAKTLYDWYYGIQPLKHVRQAGFLNRNELADWLVENWYERLSSFDKLWHDWTFPQYDLSLSNGWAGKAHMYDVLPTFERANEIVGMLPQAYRDYALAASPALAKACQTTGIPPIKMSFIAGAAAVQGAVVTAKSAAAQWVWRQAWGVVVGIADFVVHSIYGSIAAVVGAFWAAGVWAVSNLASVTAATIDNAMDRGISLLEQTGIIDQQQATQLRELRRTFNQGAQDTLEDYLNKVFKAFGAGPSEDKDGVTPKIKFFDAEKPLPWDGFLLLTVIGALFYVLYQRVRAHFANKGRNPGSNRGDSSE